VTPCLDYNEIGGVFPRDASTTSATASGALQLVGACARPAQLCGPVS